MRVKLAGVLLAFIASFTLAACNNESEGDTPTDSGGIEVDIDFDKTKTVTATPPTLATQLPHRPATTTRKQTTTSKPATTSKRR